MNPKEVLLKAHALLSEKGWTQGVMQNKKGEFCLVGAINEATPSWWSTNEPARLVREVIHGVNLAGWNDSPYRTKQEVLDVLKRAADLALPVGSGVCNENC